MKNFINTLLLTFSLIFLSYNAAAQTAPGFNSAIKPLVQLTTSNGQLDPYYNSYSIKLTNTSNAAIDLKKASIVFYSPSKIYSIWGDFGNLSYPSNPTINAEQEGSGFKITYLPNFPTTYGTTQLAAGASITLQFGISGTGIAPNTLQESVKVYTEGATPPPVTQDGEIHVSFTGPSGLPNPSLHVTGPSYPSGKTFTADSWSQVLKIQKLAYGTYTLQANPVHKGSTMYEGKLNATSLNVTNATPHTLSVSYVAVPTGTLNISVGAMPVSGLAAPQISLLDITTHQPVTGLPPANWGQTVSVPNLIAGHSYSISANDITANDTTYKPVINPVQISIAANGGSYSASITYPQPAQAQVHVNITGVGSSGSVTLNFTDTSNAVISKQVNLPGGGFSLPVGNYTISANTMTYNGQTYYAQSIVPSTLNLQTGSTSSVAITYVVQPISVGTKLYAPYVDASMVENPFVLANEAGVKGLTLAFVLSDGTCNGVLYGSPVTKEQIQQYQSQGGHVVLAFGGANGPYVEQHCSSVDNLLQAYNRIIARYGVTDLDFDIEGYYIGLTAQNLMRAQALARLQQENPLIKISFTLAVMPEGLPIYQIDFLKQAINAGVNIHLVNIMAMDYGANYVGNMGDYAISAAKALFTQLKPLYPGKSDAEIWAMIGVTPMIGVNDVQGENFTLANAQSLVNFAKEKGITFLSNWSLTRDKPCLNKWADATCSGSPDGINKNQQENYEYAKAFNQFMK